MHPLRRNTARRSLFLRNADRQPHDAACQCLSAGSTNTLLTAFLPGQQDLVLKRGSELSSNSNDSEQLAVHGRHGLGGRTAARSATRHRCANRTATCLQVLTRAEPSSVKCTCVALHPALSSPRHSASPYPDIIPPRPQW